MRWCPKCKYEYKPDIAVCPDCGSELSSEGPTLQSNEPSIILILESAAVFIFAPLVAYAVSRPIGRIFQSLGWLIEYGHDVGVLAVLLAAVCYGRYRGLRYGSKTVNQGFWAAVIMAVLTVFCLSIICPNRSFDSAFYVGIMVLNCGIFSFLTLLCIWLGLFFRNRKGLD